MTTIYVVSAMKGGYMQRIVTFKKKSDATAKKEELLKKNKYCKAKVKSETVK